MLYFFVEGIIEKFYFYFVNSEKFLRFYFIIYYYLYLLFINMWVFSFLKIEYFYLFKGSIKLYGVFKFVFFFWLNYFLNVYYI